MAILLITTVFACSIKNKTYDEFLVVFKKVCCIKIMTTRDKGLFLFYENNNNPSLPQLS